MELVTHGLVECGDCEKLIPLRDESVQHPEKQNAYICIECIDVRKAADPNAEHAPTPEGGPPADYAPVANR
ncbi:MAG TPA: hypothetical protein VKU60_19920 [Chloroflexota bacterium]|nr:hypothetical protein [Chloroflexota bacterium]